MRTNHGVIGQASIYHPSIDRIPSFTGVYLFQPVLPIFQSISTTFLSILGPSFYYMISHIPSRPCKFNCIVMNYTYTHSHDQTVNS